jgi:hypothetical protein
MTTPYRGRGGRGQYGRGYQGSNNMLPQAQADPNIPVIGNWSLVQYNRGRPNTSNIKKEKEEASSSTSAKSKNISYKQITLEESSQEYLENPIVETIMYIDDEDLSLNNSDGWSIKDRYLDTRCYPGMAGKSRPHLEMLLIGSGSVTITHNHHNGNTKDFISFSKCHINKILLPKDWGINPNNEKAIIDSQNNPINFNYWDYVNAFTQMFYYQNPKNKHSWFFSINPEVVEKSIPNWFFSWWQKFGPSLEILPEEIQNLYTAWCNTSPLIEKVASSKLITGQCPCLFFCKFQIPWIWRWNITISKDRFNVPILQRNFFYKFWTNMSSDDLKIMVEKIKASISIDKAKSIKNSNTQNFSMNEVKTYFQRKYPQETNDQIKVRVLDFMKDQFFCSFPEDNMSISSKGSKEVDEDEEVLAGESQPDPTMEDIWDSMIEIVASKTK